MNLCDAKVIKNNCLKLVYTNLISVQIESKYVYTLKAKGKLDDVKNFFAYL